MSVTMIGNAHIDPVWLWQWQEGYHEVKATFRSALDRMNEFPDFIFTCACACYYQWVEESDPAMFEEIRARVREGRWRIAGGMWIQPDMNAPSGESMARQLMISQRYFMEKFGVIATFGYNVDSFGHNAMMPQIFRKAGIDAYVWMRPGVHENPDIPEGSMLWESPDGSRVKAFRIYGEYTAPRDIPGKLDKTIFPFADRLGQDVMCFYGVGNHGGGPTIENLRSINEYIKTAPRGGEVRYGSPREFFDSLDEARLPVWKNELQHHASGCYSTHAVSKRLHRQAENALMRMETFRTLAGEPAGGECVRQAWKNLLFNEFHDIMGGCSLPEAMKDVELQLSESISAAAREENKALQKLSWRIDTSKGLPPVRSKDTDWKLWGNETLGTPIVVFNPHPFEASDTVCVRRPLKYVTDDAGNAVPVQITRASRTNGTDKYDSVFRATVPAMGWKLYWAYLEEKETVRTCLTASETTLENAFLRAEFDPETGALIHLTDKVTGTDALTAPASLRLMDISDSDTWAHMIFKFDKEAGAFGGAEIKLLERGPVRASLRVRMKHGDSRLEIIYRLNADSDQLDAELRIEMKDPQRMLKWCFPTAGQKETAEIAFGALERRGNGDEEHCQRWVSLGNLLLMNDGRYSYSADQGELRMTLAHTSIYADHYGQAQRDDECFYMDMEPLTLRMALKPFGGNLYEAQPDRRASLLNRPMVRIEETYHTGDLPAEHSAFRWDAAHAELTAFKLSEDGNGHVLRLRDTAGQPQTIAIETLGRAFHVSLGAWEFKTLYLPKDKEKPVREIPLTELE